jgi:hypothetical protein
MWHHLIHLAAHALKGYIEHRAVQRNALPAASGSSFEQHMRHLSEQTGISLALLKPMQANFEPRFEGRTFDTVLVNLPPTISIGVFSNIRFPVDRIPTAVRSRLGNFDGFELGTIDGDNGTFIVGRVNGPASKLTPRTFVQTVEEMMSRMALIDEWIVEEEYA